ncbi:MAG: hypothetical protein QM535_20155 [Limnohabitans sp.]|nr:hypothetical protein [Limnohabitans sp.]
MKKNDIIYFLIIILSGIISYYGYSFLYDLYFDFGLFCEDGFTECFDVTKRGIIYNSIFVGCIYGTFVLITNKINIKDEKDFWMLFLTFGLNLYYWSDINSSWGILALPLNSLLLLFFISFKSQRKIYYFLSIILYFIIYLYLLFDISELFYSNPKYNIIKNTLYSCHTILLLFFLFFRTKDIIKG